jgi:hypothetical protein
MNSLRFMIHLHALCITFTLGTQGDRFNS